MIVFKFFAYTDQQWDRIKVAVRDALGVDADEIEHGDITRSPRASLRTRIEMVARLYLFHSASTRQSPRRAALIALRKDAENLRASIIAALAVQVGTEYDDTTRLLPRPGVDGDMLNSTDDYFFPKLARNLDRMIEWAGQRGGNARKTARDQCWTELLAIWRELGGKATGKAAASFLIVASKPVMGSAVPDIASVMRWLERRQNKTANKVTKPVRRATR